MACGEQRNTAAQYKPRDLKVNLEPKHIRKLRAKQKNKVYLSPIEKLLLKASWLRAIHDETKLAGEAFSIVISLVNHHVNQYRKQCHSWIDPDYLEELVICDLKTLTVYGYAEWEGSGAKRRGILWDKAIADAIRLCLPNEENMSLAQVKTLIAEIDSEIVKQAEEATSQRRKGLEIRRAKSDRRNEKWLEWRSRTYGESRLMTLGPSEELRAWNDSFPQLQMSLSTIRKLRSSIT